MVIQFAPESGNLQYYVKVAAANPNGPNNTGNYFVGIDFSTVITPVPTMTSGSVSNSTAAPAFTLSVTHDLIGHFVLSASNSSGTASGVVQMTIYDQNGTAVYTLSATAGDTRSLTVFLAKGTYIPASIEDASFFRIMMPAFPAYVLLAAMVVLLVPGVRARPRGVTGGGRVAVPEGHLLP